MAKTTRGIVRRVLVVGAMAAAVAASMAVSGNADAQTTTAANNIIVGSGSQTAYSLMVSLDSLFNASPGCALLATSGTQPLNFSCPSGTSGLPAANGENPTNDVAVEEPPLGGKYGLQQLEDQGSGVSTQTAPISYATGPRGPLSTDPPGLNFVTYALDGVDWFHWTEVKGKATPSAKVTTLTNAQLAAIWTGQDTNWDQVGGKNAPIDVYVTNSGSGLLSLWDSDLGGINAQQYVISKGTAYADTHVIEQNEDASIIANGDEANAIFFLSVGRYHQTCATVCGGTKVPGKGASTTALGEINGVAPTSANILSGSFSFLVRLSNIYSNGTNSNIPAATQATLNFASEDGFLCKPQVSGGKAIIDPNTGVSYRTEIDNLIKAAGDVPLPLQTHGEGVVDAPASLSAPYSAYDSSGTNPEGYCLVTTTDGN